MENSSIKILLVDDEQDIVEIIRFNLAKEGFSIYKAYDGQQAIKLADEVCPNLIILDIMMPKLDGIETCQQLRQDSRFDDTIIVFLTARGEEFSQLAAYEAGADDYVTKPVKPKVLVSKVKSLVRRLKSDYKSGKILQLPELVIDSDGYQVRKGDDVLTLPRKEFELLFLLASSPGKVFKRNEIMNKVWGDLVFIGQRTIDVHIRKLRKKIGKKYFETIKGVGYKFIP